MNSFLHQLIFGIKMYYNALVYMKKNRMLWYLPIPALLMLLLYYLGSLINDWMATWDPKLGCLECATMNDTIWFLLKMLLSISLGLLLMKFAKYLVVIILSPMFSIISQQVEKKVTGKKYPFSFQQTVLDVKRGVKIAMRNVMWEYMFFLIILIIAFVVSDNPTSSILFYLTYVIGFFYYGFSFIDYVNERRRLDIVQSIHFMRRHRGLSVAIGLVYSLLILVPLEIGNLFELPNFMDYPFEVILQIGLNIVLLLLAALAPIWAIVTATLAMHEIVDLSKNKWSVYDEISQ